MGSTRVRAVAHGALASGTGLALASVASIAAVDLASLIDRPAVAGPGMIASLAVLPRSPAIAASTLGAVLAAALLLVAASFASTVGAHAAPTPRVEAGHHPGRGAAWLVGGLDALFALLVGAVFCLAFLPALIGLAGAQTYILTSGSMAPSMPSGTLVVAVPLTDPAALAPGEAIVFLDPEGRRITHRIVGRLASPAGPVYQTRGDAAPAPDAAPVEPGRIVGRVVAGIPGLGALRAWLFSPDGLLAIILTAAILLEAIALAEMDLRRRIRLAPDSGV